MALEWVRENIANFGGNPDEVTLWGQSAGAVSVAIHAASIKSAGLFNKVRPKTDSSTSLMKDANF